MLVQANADFRGKAPVSAAEAAAIILDGVLSGAWQILVGEDAKRLDTQVRAKPEAACGYAELFSALAEEPAGGNALSGSSQRPPARDGTARASSRPATRPYRRPG